jgi:hypothetical protein
MSNHRHDRVVIGRHADWRPYAQEIPRGYEPFGIVRCGAGPIGALVRKTDTDEYVQLNEGSTRTLDQRKVRTALGIPSQVGRPRKGYELRETFSVSLDPEDADVIREFGGGDLSAGVTRLVRDLQRHRGARPSASDAAD